MKNVSVDEKYNLEELHDLYATLAVDFEQIMITGGEPLMHPIFLDIVEAARLFFKEVHLTSSRTEVAQDPGIASLFDSVTITFHSFEHIPKVNPCVPIYASIMEGDYEEILPMLFKTMGYAGLTINENHWEPNRIRFWDLPKPNNFSIRLNESGKCCSDMEMILPNLEVIDSFEKFMECENEPTCNTKTLELRRNSPVHQEF